MSFKNIIININDNSNSSNNNNNNTRISNNISSNNGNNEARDLINAINSHDWTRCRHILRQSSRPTLLRQHYNMTRHYDHDGYNALHRLALIESSSVVIPLDIPHLLVTSYNTTTTTAATRLLSPSRNDRHETPLHLAMRYSSDDVISCWIDTAIQQQQQQQQQLVDSRRCQSNLSTTTTLTGYMGATPLHVSLRRARSPHVIQSILRFDRYVTAGRMRRLVDDRGESPLVTFFVLWNGGLNRWLCCCRSDDVRRWDRKAAIWCDFYGRERRTVEEVYRLLLVLLRGVMDDDGDDCRVPLDKLPPLISPWEAARLALVIPYCPYSVFGLLWRWCLQTSENFKIYEEDTASRQLLHVALTTISMNRDGMLYKCRECGNYVDSTSHCDSRNDGDSVEMSGDDGVDCRYYYHHCRLTYIKYCARCFLSENRPFMFEDEADFLRVPSINKSTAAIRDILKMRPAIASHPDDNGRLPLSIAVAERKTHVVLTNEKQNNGDDDDDICEVIYKGAPRALMTRDVTSHLYPFMQSAVTTRQRQEQRDQERRGRTRNDDYDTNGAEISSSSSSSSSPSLMGQFQNCYGLLIEAPHLVSFGLCHDDDE